MMPSLIKIENRIMTTVTTLRANLEVLETNLETLQAELTSVENLRDSVEIDVDSFEEEYKEMLDDSYGDFHGFSYSHILEELDPTAFRCGLNDYCDSKDVEELEEWKEAQEKVEEVESNIEDLESELEDLAVEISDLEEDC